MKEALAQARKAWEAARAAGNGSEDAAMKAAAAYSLQIGAAFMSDALSETEARALVKEVQDWAKTTLPPGLGDLVERLADAGLPDETIRHIVAKVEDAYANGDTKAFGVIHVDSNGVATTIELTPDHAADGIGRPIGNA
jgi:hypothetical protein